MNNRVKALSESFWSVSFLENGILTNTLSAAGRGGAGDADAERNQSAAQKPGVPRQFKSVRQKLQHQSIHRGAACSRELLVAEQPVARHAVFSQVFRGFHDHLLHFFIFAHPVIAHQAPRRNRNHERNADKGILRIRSQPRPVPLHPFFKLPHDFLCAQEVTVLIGLLIKSSESPEGPSGFAGIERTFLAVFFQAELLQNILPDFSGCLQGPAAAGLVVIVQQAFHPLMAELNDSADMAGRVSDLPALPDGIIAAVANIHIHPMPHRR